MNEYMIEIIAETELTEEEEMYVQARNAWRKNWRKKESLENCINTVE